MHFHVEKTTTEKLQATLDDLCTAHNIDAGEIRGVEPVYLGGRDWVAIATHAEHGVGHGVESDADVLRQDDLGLILEALGLGDFARPSYPPHMVVHQVVLPAVHRLVRQAERPQAVVRGLPPRTWPEGAWPSAAELIDWLGVTDAERQEYVTSLLQDAKRTSELLLQQRDLTLILAALGLDDHARPYSPSQVVHREILPAIRRLRRPIARVGGSESLASGPQ